MTRRIPGWLAREHRNPVVESGTATLPDGRRIDVRLTDISPQGCCVHSHETLAIGARLVLDVGPLVEVEGSVRWSLFGTAGLRFERRST